MLVRCTHCYTPFTLSQEGVVAALDEVEAKGFKFYNAYCPRCGRPNMVAKTQLEREVPGWAPRQVAMQPVVAPPLAAARPTTSAPAKPGAKPAKAVSTRPKAAPAKKKAAPAKKKAGAKKAPSKAKATKAKSVARKKGAPKKKKK
jgi:ribosomal protein S27AE